MNCKRLDEEFPWTEGPPRSPGMHLSDVIKSLMDELFGDMYPDNDDPRLQFEKGYLWEETLTMAFGKKAAVRPTEVELDGIACSPDGIDFDDDGMFLEEYKCTMKGTKHQPKDNQYYMLQVKGYCHVLGCTRAIMRIFHLAGDWSPPSPDYRVWQFDFTKQELVENWIMLLNHAKTMEGYDG